MISSFNLKLPSQIIFGPGKLAELENNIGRFGSRPLLVLGNRSFVATDHYDAVQRIYAKLGLREKTVHIDTEPSPQMINEIVAGQCGNEIDLVIAIGGGSTIDAGKALAAMLVEGGEITRFLEGVGTAAPSGKTLPFIAIPTTSGTGSEATSNAVLSSVGQQGFKSSLRHDNYIPDLALIDPNLVLSCPKNTTVACSMDCFSQLVEGYLSTNSSPFTDALALDGIRAIHRSVRAVCDDGGNLPARSDLSYAALLSGIVLCNSGLGTVHGFASAIGGFIAIPHGVICGTLMAPVNTFTLKRLRTATGSQTALGKYSKLGRICSDQQNKTDAWYQDYFIDELARLGAELEIPKLSDFGLKASDIKSIVDKTGNKFNPIQLTKEELASILGSRMN